MTKVKIHRDTVAKIPVKQVKLNGESIYPLTAAEGVVFSDGSLLSDKTFGATSYLKVDELPETGNPSIIYLVESEDTDTGDLYDEYFWSTADNAFEKFGHKVDLSNYPTFFEVGNQLDAVKTYVDNSFEDQELVVASALNDLNDRTKSLESNNTSLTSALNNMQSDIYDLQDRNVFTTEEKAKLASAITGVSVDGTAQTVTNGVVDLSIPEGVWSAGEGEGSAILTGTIGEANGDYSVVGGKYNYVDGQASLAFGAWNSTSSNRCLIGGTDTRVFDTGEHNSGATAIGYAWSLDIKPIGEANATSYTATITDADLYNASITTLNAMFKGSLIVSSDGATVIKITDCSCTKGDNNNINLTFTTASTLSETALTGETIFTLPGTYANYWSFAFNGWALGARSFAAGRQAMALNSYGVSIGNHTLTKSTNSECALGTYNASNSGTTFSVGIGNSTTRKNGIELNGGKFYVNGIGTYDGTNPSENNDLASVLANKLDSSSIAFVPGDGSHSAVLADSESIATGVSSVAEGNGIAQGNFSHAEGGYSDDSTTYLGGTAYGQGSHAEGRNTYAIKGASHSSGIGSSTEVTYTNGSVSDTTLTLTPSAEILAGQVYKIGEEYRKIEAVSVNDTVYTLTLDSALDSIDTAGSIYKIRGVAYGTSSFVGGQQNTASGTNAVAIGGNNIVSGNHSFASGTNNTVSGGSSFVIGGNSTVSGNYSSAVGRYNVVSGGGSFAIGLRNTISGVSSFATGQGNDAAGNASAAIGVNCTPTTQGTIAIGDHTHVFSSGSNHGGIAIGYSWYGDWKPVGDANATSYTNTYYSSDVSNEMLQISESVLGKMYVGCIITDYENPENRAKILTCTAVKSDSTITWTFTTDKTLSSTALDGTKAYYIPLTIANYWSFAFNGMALGGRSVAMGRGAVTLNSYGVSIGNHTLTKSTNAECAFGQWNASNSGTTFSVGIGSSTLRKNGIELNGGKFYINGVGTYDGTNPTSGTNDLASVLSNIDTTVINGIWDTTNCTTTLSTSELEDAASKIKQGKTVAVRLVEDAESDTGYFSIGTFSKEILLGSGLEAFFPTLWLSDTVATSYGLPSSGYYPVVIGFDAFTGASSIKRVLLSHSDLSGKEDVSNKVTSLSASSTDTQYPSAKCVYDLIGDIEAALNVIINGSNS